MGVGNLLRSERLFPQSNAGARPSLDGKRNEVERYVISIYCTVKQKGDKASKEKEKRVAFCCNSFLLRLWRSRRLWWGVQGSNL